MPSDLSFDFPFFESLLLSEDSNDSREDRLLTRYDFPDNYINFAHPQDYVASRTPIQKEMIFHHRDGRHARLLFRVSLQLDRDRFMPMTFVCDTGAARHFLFGSKALQVLHDERILKYDSDLDQTYLEVFGRKAPVDPTPELHDPANKIGLRMLLRLGLVLFSHPNEGFTFNASFPYLTSTTIPNIAIFPSPPQNDEEL